MFTNLFLGPKKIQANPSYYKIYEQQSELLRSLHKSIKVLISFLTVKTSMQQGGLLANHNACSLAVKVRSGIPIKSNTRNLLKLGWSWWRRKIISLVAQNELILEAQVYIPTKKTKNYIPWKYYTATININYTSRIVLEIY